MGANEDNRENRCYFCSDFKPLVFFLSQKFVWGYFLSNNERQHVASPWRPCRKLLRSSVTKINQLRTVCSRSFLTTAGMPSITLPSMSIERCFEGKQMMLNMFTVYFYLFIIHLVLKTSTIKKRKNYNHDKIPASPRVNLLADAASKNCIKYFLKSIYLTMYYILTSTISQKTSPKTWSGYATTGHGSTIVA